MRRITSVILIPILTILVGGCSVFGIATKGELEAAMDREARAQRVLEDRLAELDGRLASVADQIDDFESNLRPRLARIDSTARKNAAEMALISARWSGVRDELRANVDSLRASHGRVIDEVTWLRNDLDLARDDLTRVGARTEVARTRSQQALQIHHDSIMRERARLEARLYELDTRLDELSAIGADSTATVELEAPTVTPESPAPDEEGKVEIREVPSGD
ncbi:hypothetical protein GF314_17200 [bacterium]|nr:hypothetical protein [bacterium]